MRDGAWWGRRTFVIRRQHMSSVYLCPLLFVLACVGLDALAPLVPTLVVIGAITGIVFWTTGSSTRERALVSILGHAAVYLPYVRTGRPDVSPLPSLGVLTGVLLAYYATDLWPYCITPSEFALTAALLICLV